MMKVYIDSIIQDDPHIVTPSYVVDQVQLMDEYSRTIIFTDTDISQLFQTMVKIYIYNSYNRVRNASVNVFNDTIFT
jgi:hypothetical protein